MTTVVPRLSKSDVVPFKASQSARTGDSSSASFARALKDADASKMAVLQASEVSDSSVRLRAQTGEPGPSAGSAEAGEGSVVNGNESAKSGDLESVAKKPGDSAEAPAADSANVAGIALPLVSISGVPTAPGAVVVSDGALESEVTTALASGATAKAVELAQAAALWANGGLKDGSAEAALDPSSLSDQGDRSSSAATSVNVLSTSQGSTISGVMDPALFAAPWAGVGSTASVDGVTVGAAGASSVNVLAGGPIGLSGASAALQGAVQGTGQSAANNALLSNGRLVASLAGVVAGAGASGQRAASSANSAAVSVASALAAAATARSAQSSASSDSVGLSATAGSITGTLSVPLMSGSAGADLGGSTLGSQTGGAGSESGASSGGSRSGSSNAFIVQAANLSEPNVMAASPGAPETSARSFRSVGLGSYPTATANSTETTNAASAPGVAETQPPIVDVNLPAPQASASVTADPRAAWRDLRSRWDQPIRANAPKG